jgi:hypothetical protein
MWIPSNPPTWLVDWARVLAVLTFVLAVIQFGIKLAQDARDLRWRKSEGATRLIDAFFEDTNIVNALSLMTVDEQPYTLRDGDTPTKISRMDVDNALRVPGEPSEKDQFVQHCFSRLIFMLARIDEALHIRYILWKDINGIVGATFGVLMTDNALYNAVVEFAKVRHPYGIDALVRLRKRDARARRNRTK